MTKVPRCRCLDVCVHHDGHNNTPRYPQLQASLTAAELTTALQSTLIVTDHSIITDMPGEAVQVLLVLPPLPSYTFQELARA